MCLLLTVLYAISPSLIKVYVIIFYILFPCFDTQNDLLVTVLNAVTKKGVRR